MFELVLKYNRQKLKIEREKNGSCCELRKHLDTTKLKLKKLEKSNNVPISVKECSVNGKTKQKK